MIKLFPIILIFCVSAIFRFYNFSDLFHFTMDEEFWNYLPWNIASFYHFPAIGGHIGGTGLYSGPFFIYLMAIPEFLFRGNPLAMGMLVSGVGVITAVLIYILGAKLFGKKASFIASLLYSASFLMALYDRHYWNASLTPILSLLALFFLWGIKLGKAKYAIFLALTLILAFHAHGTGMALIVFTLISWIFFKLPLKNKYVLVAILIFLIGQLPLIFFDLRHNFQNTRAIFTYRDKPAGAPLKDRPQNILSELTYSSGRLIHFNPSDLNIEQTLCIYYSRTKAPLIVIISGVLLAFYGGFYGLKRANLGAKLSILLIFSTVVGLMIYNQKLPEYFLSPSFIPLFFLWGLALASVRNKLVIGAVLATFLYFNLTNLLEAKRSYGFPARLAAVQDGLSQVGDHPFSVSVQSSDPCLIYGFRYLYTYLGKEPSKSYMDPYFLWLYNDRIPQKQPVYEIIHVLRNGQITSQTKRYINPGDGD